MFFGISNLYFLISGKKIFLEFQSHYRSVSKDSQNNFQYLARHSFYLCYPNSESDKKFQKLFAKREDPLTFK